ncbi:MAG: hypothetical protein HKN21_03440 [Candidatus Eisenbacteria bacterium]|uniref:Right handed beta helix domain-containing protein n=1 Tax=Eiseniibacteriota bacterium TaxID=2212470 RepID=A0A7Y2E7I0_UNCEI|nr:hypothetical protein [Candidatus Eisenbacteria bacterium]
MPALLAGTLLVFYVPEALAETLHVKTSTSSRFVKIQDAIDFAKDSDVILVGSGTFTENIDLLGKAVVIRSEFGAQATTIDGGKKGAVVRCASGERETSVIDGFTLTNGRGDIDFSARRGGGIFCVGSTPTIRNCWIVNNHTEGDRAWGGAVYLTESGPGTLILEGNVIADNSSYRVGGGLCLLGDAIVRNNKILRNSSLNGDGGGIYSPVGNIVLEENLIEGNVARDRAGGAYFLRPGPRQGAVTIFRNIIVSNTASTLFGEECGGGGLWLFGGTIEVRENTIAYNRATAANAFGGGGICVNEVRDPIVIERNIIYRNQEGGVDCWHCEQRQPILRRNILYANGVDEVLSEGSGVFDASENLFVDPMFCELPDNDFGSVAGASPALNQPYGTIGAVETPGCGPFIAVSVEETTWGGIKKLLSR